MCKEGFLKAVAFRLWHKGSVRSFFPIQHFVLSTRAHFLRLSRFSGEQTPSEERKHLDIWQRRTYRPLFVALTKRPSPQQTSML